MSETVLLWLFGVLLTVLGGWNLVLTGWMFKMWTSQTQMQVLMVVLSKKAAEILHSPQDHFGIDALLEKYVMHDHDLSHQEWLELSTKLDEIMADKSISPGHRVLAMFVKELSVHKLKNTLNYKVDKPANIVSQ